MSSLFFVFVAAGLCGNGRIGAMALLAVPNRIGCRPRTSTTSSSWALFASTMQQEPQRNNTGKHYLETSLQFVARTVFASDPIPLPKNTTLLDFFMVEGNRNHLLLGEGQQRHTAGPSLPAVEPLYPIPLELWDRWRKEAALAAGAIEPDMDHDTLLRVKSSGIPFPAGMTIFSDSVIGVKLLTGENECPEYQFTLVQDNVRVEGPTPMVWLTNKLTGFEKEKREQTTHSFSSLRVQKSSGDNDGGGDDSNTVIFRSNSLIEINIPFSSTLLRLLPMNQEKCNQLGSASIQKAFDEKGAASFLNFVEAYRKWLRADNGQ